MLTLLKLGLSAVILAFASPVLAQNADAATHAAIEATLNNYLTGSSYNKPVQIKASDYVSTAYVSDNAAKRSKAGHSGVDTLYAAICSGENSCAK